MSQPSNYYDILQVSPGAAPEVIEAAYKSLQQAAHPDQGDQEAYSKLLNAARETLIDPDKRRAYDHSLGGGSSVDRETQGPPTVPRAPKAKTIKLTGACHPCGAGIDYSFLCPYCALAADSDLNARRFADFKKRNQQSVIDSWLEGLAIGASLVMALALALFWMRESFWAEVLFIGAYTAISTVIYKWGFKHLEVERSFSQHDVDAGVRSLLEKKDIAYLYNHSDVRFRGNGDWLVIRGHHLYFKGSRLTKQPLEGISGVKVLTEQTGEGGSKVIKYKLTFVGSHTRYTFNFGTNGQAAKQWQKLLSNR